MMAAAIRRWPNAEFYFKFNDDVYLSVGESPVLTAACPW